MANAREEVYQSCRLCSLYGDVFKPKRSIFLINEITRIYWQIIKPEHTPDHTYVFLLQIHTDVLSRKQEEEE